MDKNSWGAQYGLVLASSSPIPLLRTDNPYFFIAVFHPKKFSWTKKFQTKEDFEQKVLNCNDLESKLYSR